MYTLSNRLKIFSIALIIIGALGWFYSYSVSHITLEEVKTMLASESHHGHSHSVIEKENEMHHNEYVDEYNSKNHDSAHLKKQVSYLRRGEEPVGRFLPIRRSLCYDRAWGLPCD